MSRPFDASRQAAEPAAPTAQDTRTSPAGPRAVETSTTPPIPVNGHKWFVRAPVPSDRETVEHENLHFAEAVEQKLVIDPRSRAAAVEQYRRLAAALHHSQKQFGTKVVMVASAVNAEGKSLSICNVALTLSESYRRRVLLVDGDLRHPGLHEIFQLPVTSGLGEALRADVARPLPLFDVTPNLVVLPAGRPDPDPLGGLASERMSQIFDEASADFDWVMVDTPPASLVPDAKHLAAFADAIVLVVRAGRSPCVLVQQTIEALGPEKVVGVLLNGAEAASTRQQNGYYGYGYGAKRG
jgi:protein-tyrosine kinase